MALQEPQGNSLGDPILVEDSNEEEEILEIMREEFKVGPRVVTDLVLIKDE